MQAKAGIVPRAFTWDAKSNYGCSVVVDNVVDCAAVVLLLVYGLHCTGRNACD